ncbi:unnamed protein product [Dovyalis caffra]|uniref:Methyltransferase type 11 domain-containing protein n=1 Tax=Dovyalis caffra TaxID=77055 RepID=A0AAV1SQJ6_9ROSI|nr:unnamed protein product [Dovyalis caffra]
MAGSYDKQAAIYLDGRPRYPKEWFSMLAALTPDHSLAWDAGTGNGQAAIDVKHYKQVIATDISEELLKHAIQHPQIQYMHPLSSMSGDELVNLIGGENSIDLVTVATAVHWFDLEKLYPVVKRVLKKPGGVVAAWRYNIMQVSTEMDPLLKKFYEGIEVFLFKTQKCRCSAVNTAKQQGVNLLSEEVEKELESAWGGPELVRTVIYKTYMHLNCTLAVAPKFIIVVIAVHLLFGANMTL